MGEAKHTRLWESQISRSDRWVKKPHLPYEQKGLSGGPASGNHGGLVAPPCKKVTNLCMTCALHVVGTVRRGGTTHCLSLWRGAILCSS